MEGKPVTPAQKKLKQFKPVDESYQADVNDPIDVAIDLRRKNGVMVISEADARKQRIQCPKPMKLKAPAQEHQDLLQSQQAPPP